MSKRRVKITTTSDKIGSIVEKLSGTNIEVSVVVDMLESKENYEFLSKDSSVINWGLVEDTAIKTKDVEPSSTSGKHHRELLKPSIINILKSAGINTVDIYPGEILKVIECVWELKKLYPSLHYTESNVARALSTYYTKSEDFSSSNMREYLITKKVLADLIGGYNSAYLDKSKIYPELFDRLGDVWDSINKYDNLTELVYMIYDINILGSAQGAR